jgi:hypothetical protein
VGRVTGDAGFSGSVEKGESGAILLRKPNLVHRAAGGPGVRNLSHDVYSRDRAATPPAYRENGFDLKPHDPVQHLRGELVRRFARGRKGLELWQDETLIFVGRNDENFLGWAVRHKALENNIYMNNYGVNRIGFSFSDRDYTDFQRNAGPSRKIKVCFGLTIEDVYVANHGTTYELSARPIDRPGSYSEKKAPAEDRTFWIDFTLKDAVPEVEALKLLRKFTTASELRTSRYHMSILCRFPNALIARGRLIMLDSA